MVQRTTYPTVCLIDPRKNWEWRKVSHAGLSQPFSSQFTVDNTVKKRYTLKPSKGPKIELLYPPSLAGLSGQHSILLNAEPWDNIIPKW